MELVAQPGSLVACTLLGNRARQSYPPSIICWEENYCGRQGCQLLCYCINTLVEFILFLVLILLLGLIFLQVYVYPNSCSAVCLGSRVLACVSSILHVILVRFHVYFLSRPFYIPFKNFIRDSFSIKQSVAFLVNIGGERKGITTGSVSCLNSYIVHLMLNALFLLPVSNVKLHLCKTWRRMKGWLHSSTHS
jgi:hypothetical protein